MASFLVYIMDNFMIVFIIFCIIWIYSFIKTLISKFEGSNEKLIWIIVLIFIPITALLFIFIGKKNIIQNKSNKTDFKEKIFMVIFFTVFGTISLYLSIKGVKFFFPEWESSNRGYLAGALSAPVLLVLMYVFNNTLDIFSRLTQDKRTIKQLNKKANKGDAESQNRLAVRYHDGNGTPKDMNKALYWYEKAAEQKDTWALYNMAELYFKGEFVERDYDRARKLYQEASKDNHKESLNRLGQIYHHGHGVEIDKKQAVDYYQKSALLNYSSANFNLALCYKDGKGVEKDYTKAINFFKKSEELGDKDASFEIGMMHRDGLGVVKDEKEAIDYFEKATEFNNSAAYIQIAYLYFFGIGSIKQNYNIAFKNFEQSSNLGNMTARSYLAEMYFKGLGRAKNVQKSQELLAIPLEQNIEKAIEINQALGKEENK